MLDFFLLLPQVSETEHEMASQPATWRRAAGLAPGLIETLTAPGERIAYLGCGTSWFVAQSIAAERELLGVGESDALCASEARLHGRAYDRVVAISRSGTTTEVLRSLAEAHPGSRTVAVTAVAGMPIADAADETIVLDFADERSVVQTRFATTALALARACLGLDVDRSASQAEQVLAEELPVDPAAFERFVFLGAGPCLGLANEAALKVREASQSWCESYPSMEYRHGPIAVADADTLVMLFGTPPDGLADEIAATGATVLASDLDPLARLVQAQRIAVALAHARGLDVDHPRNLTRSVVLP